MDIISQPKRKQSKVGVNVNVGTGYVARFTQSTGGNPQTQHGAQFTIALRPSIAISRRKYHYRSCGPVRAFCLDYRGVFDRQKMFLDLGASVAAYAKANPQDNRPGWVVQPFAGVSYLSMLHTTLGVTAGAGYLLDITRNNGATTLHHGPYVKFGFQMPVTSRAWRIKSLMRDRFWLPSLKLGTRINLLMDRDNKVNGWELSLAMTLIL